MTPRKNLILALAIAGMFYLAFNLPGLPFSFDWHLDRDVFEHFDQRSEITVGQDLATQNLFAAAMMVQRANEPALFEMPGVIGTGVGFTDAGTPSIKIFVDGSNPLASSLESFPQALDKFPVSIQTAGPFMALPAQASITMDEGDESGTSLSTTRFDRPVPIGISTGHTRSTAGTIGALVTDGTQTYALSNWHVFVPAGQARVGDELLQPGPIDGGAQPADVIGTLSAFEPVALSPFASNRIDAAIALTDQVMAQTPSDGYGSPRSETLEAKPGLAVQKYGRTTRHTIGEVDAINASINVAYGSAGSQVGRFTGQVVVCCDFSQGGDSGSLIVSRDVDEDGNSGPNDRRPVALLFAGDGRLTIGNPIDLVLDRFGVTIVGEDSGN